MKKAIYVILAAALMLAAFCGCGGDSALNAKDPVTLTMWHVYGEQADSPMNQLVDEFNRTVGQENGVVIDVTLMSSTAQIGEKLLDAQRGTPGVPSMPDLFFCHNNNVAELGAENLLDWNDMFETAELERYIPAFLEDGMVDGHLSVFPVSKSTHVLCVAGCQFDRFAADTGVSYDDLATWDGFFDVAEKYYDWSGGQPFCALDYLIRAVELHAISLGDEDFYTQDGWYDFDNETFKASWMRFAEALGKGHILVSDLYSNTQVMTGEVPAGLGSSAAILYYNDTVTYPDNSSEPMELHVLPMPKTDGCDRLVTQAGVGLCAYKTTDQKAEAAALFARWLTEPERNLDFCVQSGYMPVTQEAFEAVEDYDYPSEAYRSLYEALKITNDSSTALAEPSFAGYYDKIYELYDALRAEQGSFAERYAAGEDAAAMAAEAWETFRAIG